MANAAPQQNQAGPGLFRRNFLRAGEIVAGWLEPLTLFVGWRFGLGFLAFMAGTLLPVLDRSGTAPYTPQNLGPISERFWSVWSHWDGE